MAKLSIVAGATSQSVNIFIQNSSVTTGAGLTGLVFNSSSLIAYYTFTGANATSTAITLATLAAVNSAYSSGGFKEIDSTHMPGLYRLDIPNSALASGNGQSVTIMLSGATNMAPCVLEIELTGWNNQDGVHGGLSCLPNTAVTTNASLLTSGTGTDQLSVTSGRVDLGKILGTAVSTPATAGILDVNVKNMNNVAATSITTINANIGVTQPINFTGTAGSALVKSDMQDIAGSAVSTSTAQIGVNVVNIAGSASTGAAGYVGVDWGQVTNKTTTNALTGTTISSSQTITSVSGSVGSVTGNVGGSVGSVTAGVTVSTNNDKTGYALTSAYDFAKGTVAMAESYPVLGATITPAQALYNVVQHLNEMNIVSTTLTVKKRDQSTTAKTFTLDSVTTPTTITEAS